MSAPPAQPPEQGSAGAVGWAAGSQLLMDQFLPSYDVAVVHADVLRAPPSTPSSPMGSAGPCDG